MLVNRGISNQDACASRSERTGNGTCSFSYVYRSNQPSSKADNLVLAGSCVPPFGSTFKSFLGTKVLLTVLAHQESSS